MSTKRVNLAAARNPAIRTLHFTWTAFFLTFVLWFSHAPMKSSIMDAFDLSLPQWKALLILNVALTIPARIVIGILVDRFGPRLTYGLLLMVAGVLTTLFALSTSFEMLAFTRFLMGFIGAGVGGIALGWIGVFTSIMVYHDTGRIGWRFRRTAERFGETRSAQTSPHDEDGDRNRSGLFAAALASRWNRSAVGRGTAGESVVLFLGPCPTHAPSSSFPRSLIRMSSQQPLSDLLHQRTGPLTAELLQEPGQFGLGQLPAHRQPDATTSSICGFCSTGCQLQLHLQDGEAIGLSPHPFYPVNSGMACPKGWEALTVLESKNRSTTPMLRQSDGVLQPIDWSRAASTFTTRFKEIQQRHGPESVAFLSTGQIATEEMAYLGAFTKFGMGVVHGDGNTRQCMATAVVAYKQSFGFDAPPYTYADFEESDVIVLVGANPCIAHPILWQRIMHNRKNPEIVVIDPRRTETAQAATRHIALKPKGDLDLFYAIAHCLVRDDRLDHDFLAAHTTQFGEFANFVSRFRPEACTTSTGLAVDEIESLARIVSQPGKRVSWWWTMGVNQSHQGVRTAQSIINLALMTGNIGKPGTGANSITGQCNAMGSRLFSNTTNLLGGHDFNSPDDRRKIAAILDIPEERIPSEPGWAYDQIIEGIESGSIRGLWIIATNPAHSWINQNRFHTLREKLEFLVVQDMYATTETARSCDLLLPAAGWGEKTGTFINSERRIGTIRQVRRAPGQALSDFRIFQLLSHAWGCADLFGKWDSPEAVFRILQRCSAGQACDITGIGGYDMLDRFGGIQWPLAAGFPVDAGIPRERRLFTDGRFHHPDGKARFVFSPPRPLPEPVSDAYPLVLLTGRGSSAQWHTQTRTANSAILRMLHPGVLVLNLHPDDAGDRGIHDGDRVSVSTTRASLTATATLSSSLRRGDVFLPMHDSAVNKLTHQSVDPHSRQPAYKACAVQVKRIERTAPADTVVTA